MGAQLFDRVCTVAIGDLSWTGLRVAFKITKTARRHPNPAEVTIWNLSASSRAAIDRGQAVRLVAGYVDNAELIFAGSVVDVESKRDGPDWQTKITARDGDAAWRATTRRAYAGAVPVVDVVDKVAADLGLQLAAPARDLLGAAGSTRGALVLHGYSHDQIDVVLRSLGLEWSIQDGALQVVAAGGVTTEPAILLSPDTGLIGSPHHAGKASSLVTSTKAKALAKSVHARQHVVAVSLLQPGLRPGRRVDLQADQIAGSFRVDRVEHRGDTHGQDWYSEAELRGI